MNKIFKKLAGGGIQKHLKKRRSYPFTLAFNEQGECIGDKNGVANISEFPAASFINICHRNGKTTVIRKAANYEGEEVVQS